MTRLSGVPSSRLYTGSFFTVLSNVFELPELLLLEGDSGSKVGSGQGRDVSPTFSRSVEGD